MTSFKDKVLSVVATIPKGQTLSYRSVAEKAGNARAARAVGMIMSKNQNKHIPCHRVIRSDGTAGGYNGLRGKDKKKILQKEIKNTK